MPSLFSCSPVIRECSWKKSQIEKNIFELRSIHLFCDQPYKEVLEVKFQACNFTVVLSFIGVFEDFGFDFVFEDIFPTFFAEFLIT